MSSDLKPFHESAVAVMEEFCHTVAATRATASFARVLLLTTFTPANHDAIIVSWKRLAEMADLSQTVIDHVVSHLLEQKRLIEEKHKPSVDPARGSGLFLGHGLESEPRTYVHPTHWNFTM